MVINRNEDRLRYSSLKLTERLWKHLDGRRHRQFYLMFVLMIISAATEMISIGAILPFLAILTDPESIFNNPNVYPFMVMFDFSKPSQLVLPLTLFFIVAALLAGALRLSVLIITTRFSFAVGADLGKDIYQKTLYQPYSVHIDRNSSEVMNGVINKTDTVIYGVLLSILTIISSISIITGICLTLIIVEPFLSLLAILGFLSVYGGLLFLTKSRLEKSSKSIATESTKLIKALQEGLEGIRDILLLGCQKLFSNIFHTADKKLRKSQGDAHIISGSPRYVIETLFMLIIAISAFFLSKTEVGLLGAIPVLGVLALGAQKLIPSFQQVYGSISNIRAAKESLIDVLTLLDQHVPKSLLEQNVKKLCFSKEIRLENVEFSYLPTQPLIFKNIRLRIKKGTKVGLIGETGSGKTTLMDLIMGLLQPVKGVISIDECALSQCNIKGWQANIAHVPQNIYIADGSLIDNIAFGETRDAVDLNKINKIIEKVKLNELVDSWQHGAETILGERGSRLSGGQKQRIGIARALYRDVEVVCFDEPTSALDQATENSIIEAINDLEKDITVFIIAHRISTLSICDVVFRVKGQIVSKVDKSTINISRK